MDTYVPGTAMKAGDRFTFGGYDWVCLDPAACWGDGILAMMDEFYRDENGRKSFKFDANNNGDYRVATIRTVLHNIAADLGEDNLLPRTVDLTADTGDTAFGTTEDLVSLPSADDCRFYRKIMPKFDDYFWTCTPWRIDDAGTAHRVRICHTGHGGALDHYTADYSSGVAPLVILKSSIFQSTPLGVGDDAEEETSESSEADFGWLFGDGDANLYEKALATLPRHPNDKDGWHGFWVSGAEEIMCPSEREASTLADFFEDCGFDVMHTFHYDDKERDGLYYDWWSVYVDGQ